MSDASGVWEWLVNLPKHLAGFVGWLSTPFQVGSLEITPLAVFGAGFGGFIAVVLVLKIKNLFI